MTPTGTLVVVIKRLPDFVTFLTQQDDVHVTVAAATAAAAASSPAAASSAASSSSSSAAVDPSLQPLTDALVALKIGAHKTCAALAEALEQEGVMGIDDLRLFPETKARELLARVGLKEMQQLKLMQAVVQSPPPPHVTRHALRATRAASRLQLMAGLLLVLPGALSPRSRRSLCLQVRT